MTYNTTLPLTILTITAKTVIAHVAQTTLLRQHELPTLTHAGRTWVPFTMRLRDVHTATFHRQRAGYEIEYRPLRPRKPRRIPTLPQWPCSDCGKHITRHRAYRWVSYAVEGGSRIVGIQRTVNGAYCVTCASKAARQEEARGEHPC